MEERREGRTDTPLSPSNMLGSPPMSAFTYTAPAYIHLPNIISSDLKTRRNAMVSHKDLKKQFMEKGVTYHRQLFLRNIATRSKLNAGYEQLFGWLNEIANELLMEELEVVLWGIYMEQAISNELVYEEEVWLWLSAFAAKQYFSVDVRVLENACGSHVKGFSSIYADWRSRTTMALDVSLMDLNSMLTALSRPSSSPDRGLGRDYNAVVTELLTPPIDKCKAEETEEKSEQCS